MKTFPILYKRAKTGAIQFWSVSVIDHQGGYPEIRKTSGKLNTQNPVIHGEFVKEGKNLSKSNETTALQQALSQAQSDWNKKRGEGYKSLEDLGIHETENMQPGTYACNKGFYTLQECLELMLPQFNTDASGNVKPMLAKAVDWSKVKYPCLMQPKLDGVRCLMVVDRKGPDLEVKFLSRNGKEYTTLSHIADDVVEKASAEPFVLYGEIYSDELSFQEIVAAVKKQRPDSLKLKFRSYDIVNDETQQQSWERAVDLVDSIQSPHLQLVLSLRVDTKDDIKQAHDEWVAEGYEGAMIRHLDGMYGQGQRSSDLLKVKEFDETEFRAKFFSTGQREEDLIVYCETKDGAEFSAKMMGTKEYKEGLVREHGLEQRIKRNITIKHFGWTDDGLPRFPIGKAFRDE